MTDERREFIRQNIHQQLIAHTLLVKMGGIQNILFSDLVANTLDMALWFHIEHERIIN